MNNINIALQNIERLKKEAANHKQQAKALKEQSSEIMRQAREHEIQARRLRRECQEMEQNHEEQVINQIETETDFAALYHPQALRQLMKARITHPKNRHDTLNKYDFILYAILRGKPWHTGLSPNTRFVAIHERRIDDIQAYCANHLAGVIASDLVARHAERLPQDRWGKPSWKAKHHFRKLAMQELPLLALCQAHIHSHALPNFFDK